MPIQSQDPFDKMLAVNPWQQGSNHVCVLFGHVDRAALRQLWTTSTHQVRVALERGAIRQVQDQVCVDQVFIAELSVVPRTQGRHRTQRR
mmetsp:Transcript_63108/g.137143  ORF Transcript_63108/g.137143 Transcript_63108/m.137143 type:complete len:90 (+) Transcript_63108:892-1161(+)